MTFNITWTLNNERHCCINYGRTPGEAAERVKRDVVKRFGAEPTIEQVKPCKVKHR